MSDPTTPRGMTAEKLRSIASWLDVLDAIAERVVFTLAGDDTTAIDGKVLVAVRGKEVQEDLRRWADEIAAAASLDTPQEPQDG